MSQKSVLITGGAGFIGSHVADELLLHGHRVRAFDRLHRQVHGAESKRPEYLNPEVELIRGDIRDMTMLERALKGIDVVYHFAACVGAAASMERIEEFLSINAVGTAVLLEALMQHPVERLILASSMNIYGEGACRDAADKICERPTRTPAQLRRGDWEVRDANGAPLRPLPTPESHSAAPISVYGLSKYAQEQTTLMVARNRGMISVSLRLSTVYGPRQPLSNPHSGALTVFGARLLSGQAPLLHEDGEQRRDFLSVHDAARACHLALESGSVDGKAINVGSGFAYSVHQAAHYLASELGCPQIVPERTGQYRPGGVRHIFPDISRARSALGFEPRVSLPEGLAELADYWRTQRTFARIAERKNQVAWAS